MLIPSLSSSLTALLIVMGLGYWTSTVQAGSLSQHPLAQNSQGRSLTADASPVDRDQAFADGVTALGNGDFQTAETLFRGIVQAAPDDLESRLILALTFFARDNYDGAIEATQQILQRDPEFLDAYVLLGFTLLLKNRFEESAFVSQQALQLDPNAADAHENLGLALERMGQLDEAIAAYEQAIAIDRTLTLAPRRLSRLTAGDLDVAQRSFATDLENYRDSVKQELQLAFQSLSASTSLINKCNALADTVNTAQGFLAEFEAELQQFSDVITAAEGLDGIQQAARQYVDAIDTFVVQLDELSITLERLALEDSELSRFRDRYVQIFNEFIQALDTTGMAMAAVLAVTSSDEVPAALEQFLATTTAALDSMELTGLQEDELIKQTNAYCGVTPQE